MEVFVVFHQTYYLIDRVGLPRSHFQTKCLAQRTAATKQLARKSLVDDRGLGRVKRIVIVEIPAGKKRSSERLEISGRDARQPREPLHLPVNQNILVPTAAADGNDAGIRRALHSGNALDTVDQFALEGQAALFGHVEAGVREVSDNDALLAPNRVHSSDVAWYAHVKWR